MALRRPRRGASGRASEGVPEDEREEAPRRDPRRTAADVRAGARKASGPLLAGTGEILAIGREMLAIPAAMALGLAERLGLIILAVLRFAWPLVLAALAAARRGLDLAAREATPARAIAAVALAACLLLAISQFLDYREVRAGVSAYAEVEQVAPPPRISGSTETTGSAHLYAVLLLAIAAGALVVLSMLGRWRLARLLVPLGLAALAIAVFIDAPAGLDEGANAIEFQGAEARLLEPFWVQVWAAAVITLCGMLLALALRPQVRRRRAGADASRGRSAVGRGRVQGAAS
ncbi:MAG: hypothetical protein ACR2G3_00730 [Solirubrobacterales bacterium]